MININGFIFKELNCPYGATKIMQYVMIDSKLVNTDEHVRNFTKTFREDCESYL